MGADRVLLAPSACLRRAISGLGGFESVQWRGGRTVLDYPAAVNGREAPDCIADVEGQDHF